MVAEINPFIMTDDRSNNGITIDNSAISIANNIG
jgi:hypothetical protein